MNARLFLLLYLLRDTLHRWCRRISSPLSRLLVVSSLSFCGVLFLSNYALSIRTLTEKIMQSGADLLVASEFVSAEQIVPGEGRVLITTDPGECEIYILHDLIIAGKIGTTSYNIVEYMPELTKLLPDTGNALFLLPAVPADHSTPADIDIEGHRVQGIVLNEARAGFLRKLYPAGALFIPHGSSPFNDRSLGMFRKYVLRFRDVDAKKVARWEQTLQLLSRLDERNFNIISSRAMLQELDTLRELQFRFRLGIMLGSCFVIGLLLTSISSMEFRQNEYVYALMGSFGISRLTLFFTFVAENTLLVFGGFGIALLALDNTGQYMVDKLYKMSNYRFSLDILQDDIHIFLTAFIFCILISSLPILAAIFRPIGKILK